MLEQYADTLPALLAIVFVGSIIQGASGFGFGLFAVAALSLFLKLTVSSPLLALLNTPVVVYVLWVLRGHVKWDHVWPIAVTMVLGVPLGAYFLIKCPQEILLRVLAVVLVLASVRSFRAQNGNGNAKGTTDPPAEETRSGTRHRANAGIIGLVTGALAGAYGAGGPPVIAYVYGRPWTKEERTATLQAIFVISLAIRIVTYGASGLYDTAILLVSLLCIPAGALGMVLGQAIFRRFPPRAMELFVAVFLLLVAVKLFIWPGAI